MSKLFTSESVTEGHPDKMADQISDAILDAILKDDPNGRVACETFVTTGLVFVSGEITTKCYVDIPHVVRKTIRDIGYTRAKYGFDCDTCAVMTAIDEQSSDIAMGVDKALEKKEGATDAFSQIGAGDQGMMFGYACDETESLLPAPIHYAHLLCRKMSEERKSGFLPYLGPDGKSMVTMAYQDGRPQSIPTIVLSSQHTPAVGQEQIRRDLIERVIRPVIPNQLLEHTDILVNPTGRFVKGGPCADTGLTGRKLMVDTYGGLAAHGGGAFSGKDPTKVDRSAAYMARAIARNVVGAWLAEECQVSISYAIGKAEPTAVEIDTFGTARVDEDVIRLAVLDVFDLRPAAIMSLLHLRAPIYADTAAYGHFNGYKFNWENLDKTEELRKAVEKYAD